MPNDTDLYDFFVSYASADNKPTAANPLGIISELVNGILAEHQTFTGGPKLTCFLDTDAIRHGHDWQHTLHDGIAKSRAFVAFLSPNYFASEWCQREWRAWTEHEISIHILSQGSRPVYIIEVPGYDSHHIPPSKVADDIRSLLASRTPAERVAGNPAATIKQIRRTQHQPVQPFYDTGRNLLRRDDLDRVLKSLATDLNTLSATVKAAVLSNAG